MPATGTYPYSSTSTFSETCASWNQPIAGSALSHEAPFGAIISRTGDAAEDNPFRFSTKYHEATDVGTSGDTPRLVYYGYRFYDPEFGRWVSRDPVWEDGWRVLLAHSVSDLERIFASATVPDDGVAYGFVRNRPADGYDPWGLQAENLVSELSLSFPKIGHWRSQVVISFFAGSDSGRDGCGKKCDAPRFAQVVKVSSGNAYYNRRWGTGGTWVIDSDAANYPLYPFQTKVSGSSTMTDAPGATYGLINPATWLYRYNMDFETCAICTDEGRGKYWVISCVNWGMEGGGIGRTRRYGEGTIYGRNGPSSSFLGAFPPGLLGKNGE